MKLYQHKIDYVLQNRTLNHVLFWAAYLLFTTIIASINTNHIVGDFIKNLSLLPSQLLAAYFLNYYQIPKLLLKKKYILFIITFFFFGYFFLAFGRFSIVHIAEPFIRKDFEQESILEILTDSDYLIKVYFPAIYSVVFIMFVIKVIKQRALEKQKIERLEKEKIENELKFLRTQIQPHFLFNTLNNLYALTLEKSDLAPQVVLKLSELLDFILYQSNQPEIAIEKEIELIQGFIDLESLRYGERLKLKFHHQIDDKNSKITPLLLLPFVENAFKHGANKNPNNPEININLMVDNNELFFEIYNSKSSHIKNAIDSFNGGIGNKNLKRQLELNYENRFDLSVKENDNSYKVSLNIKL